ncbi:murein transglycosylase A [Methyloradius palustris]|uniref:peptidoglycan lytic exotransglycosylase n=1 Tax=Methyloradius palustris TaxID=2778876 RepID=A0A8D5G5W4_9PROT|nr:murein transglycosylase A [Methyloradius palustris]BCM26265.1 membrane protein [Methyloradius palustris]
MPLKARHCFTIFLVLLLSACGGAAIKPDNTKTSASKTESIHNKDKPVCECAENTPIPEPQKPAQEPKAGETRIPDYSLLRSANWQDLAGIEQDNLTMAWPAWLQSCSALKTKPAWQNVCDVAANMKNPSVGVIQNYFKQYFNVYRTTNADGSDTGMITGYYEPLLKGSLVKTDAYRYPLYRQPSDLITVDLASIYPELANKRLRGRVIGNKLVPYYNRGEIESEQSPLQGNELLWVDDVIDLFFLQIQGSGLVQLENGEQIHVGYADQNGQAYQSIGRLLIQSGELTSDKASMQGIKNWALTHPEKLRDLLNSNPSYVFFRELPAGLPGPLGALGVPILGERAVAVDPRFVPLGAPIFLATTFPNTSKPLNRLMMAQDTGGAIKGGVRADFFWGFGPDATRQAGSMKQKGKIWVLLPKEFVFP